VKRIIVLAVTLAVCAAAATGCSGIAPYQSVDLNEDLSPETLRRYEREYRDAHAGGDHDGAVTLEYTNWRSLGLLGYYRRVTVTRVRGADGPLYRVMIGHGASESHAPETDKEKGSLSSESAPER